MKKQQQLKAYLKEVTKEPVLIAFSGGVDSSLLLFEACERAKENQTAVHAVTLHTMLHPMKDLEVAKKVAEEAGAIHHVLKVDELKDAGILDNPVNRCYLCKKCLFTMVRELADSLGITCIMEGTNEDDLYVYRPGLKALEELHIHSPLAQCHLTKEEVRALAREHKISVADRPSTPCFATRFPYGTKLEYTQLERAQQGEAFLQSFGFYNVRLRVYGDTVRIEVGEADFVKVLEQRASIIEYLKKKLGYPYVTLDLEGFRSGSMDEVIEKI